MFKSLYKQKYGTRGPANVYLIADGQGVLKDIVGKVKYGKFITFLRELLLPHGFPESVSGDYLTYQLWDTLQAFCSTISGTLTTQAVLKGVGVGNSLASPLAATVTWILKDGLGMVGKITFAWWKGTYLDSDCKKWRFFADLLNDIALTMEFLLFYYPEFSTIILCISSSMKAIVGVAGGATRAAITQHQAVRGNMADVSAKDGSQETFVNLIASLTGLLLLTYIDTNRLIGLLFLILTVLHIFANYQAVRSIIMETFNAARFRALFDFFMLTDKSTNPRSINMVEPVLLGRGLTDMDICDHRILMGTTMKRALLSNKFQVNEFLEILELYKGGKYIVIHDFHQMVIYVIIHRKADACDILQSYFHALMLGIMSSSFSRDQVNHSVNVLTYMKKTSIFKFEREIRVQNTDLHLLTIVNEIVKDKFPTFKERAVNEGWNMLDHNLVLDEWRGEW